MMIRMSDMSDKPRMFLEGYMQAIKDIQNYYFKPASETRDNLYKTMERMYFEMFRKLDSKKGDVK